MERNVLAGVLIQSFEIYGGVLLTRTAEWIGYRVVLMPCRGGNQKPGATD